MTSCQKHNTDSARFRVIIFTILMLLLAACNLTNRAPVPTAQPTPVPLSPLPTTPPLSTGIDSGAPLNDSTCLLTPANWISYTVQPGDSLGAIAVAIDTPLADLVANNCLENADTIFVEQVIYLPRAP
ncbi:MAG: LysM peptidoglycan-binding domain-containing protein [Anaerolineae bacterium]|nr:LysM peptidoglycan-binding domain-containing protein [Anaerolineae bacterium]